MSILSSKILPVPHISMSLYVFFFSYWSFLSPFFKSYIFYIYFSYCSWLHVIAYNNFGTLKSIDFACDFRKKNIVWLYSKITNKVLSIILYTRRVTITTTTDNAWLDIISDIPCLLQVMFLPPLFHSASAYSLSPPNSRTSHTEGFSRHFSCG